MTTIHVDLDINLDAFIRDNSSLFHQHNIDYNLWPETDKRLGDGGFGIVYKTDLPGVVCKITTDSNEYKMARMAVSEEWQHIVRYNKIVDFGEFKAPDLFSGGIGHIYGLWREEASLIGMLEDAVRCAEPNIQNFHLGILVSTLSDLSQGGKTVLSCLRKICETSIRQPRFSPGDFARLQTTENAWDIACSERNSWKKVVDESAYMISIIKRLSRSNSCTGRVLVSGMLATLDSGYLMCDVKSHNMGVVNRGKKKVLVITDPGGSVPFFLDQKDRRREIIESL